MLEVSSGEKAFKPEVFGRGVKRPIPGTLGGPGSLDTSLLWMVSSAADEIPAWGVMPKLRDIKLRAFFPTESVFASALGVVASRNATFSWVLEGPDDEARRYHDIFENANWGQGWTDFITKLSIDLYTQDYGAFIELVREEDNASAPVIGINHLDAYRCYFTGQPQVPVVYQDQRGNYYPLDWWRVVSLGELPMPVEGLPGLQLCALSRVLRACQVWRNISLYMEEKTSGRRSRAIHLIKGITASQLQEVLTTFKLQADSAGLVRYVDPLIVPSVDPKADIGHDTLEMASLPDGWSAADEFQRYVAHIAMGFFSDYQDFLPLSQGALGSSQQSQILHMKGRSKGAGLFQKILTHAINFNVLPYGVEFGFQRQDLQEELDEATIKLQRAQTRQIQVATGEIDGPAARRLAFEMGDLPEDVANLAAQNQAAALGAEAKPVDTDELVLLTDDVPAQETEMPEDTPLGWEGLNALNAYTKNKRKKAFRRFADYP